MKVILTGSTGFIGNEVLNQCLNNSSITSIVVLSRRELPASLVDANPKLKVVVMEDFALYPDNVLREIQGADACIWALGKAVAKSDEEARRIKFDYTFAAAKALNQTHTREKHGKLRFVFLSGKIAERDQTTSLWYMQEHRRIAGQLETDLVSFAQEHKDNFETYILKPSMVLSKTSSYIETICSYLIPTVKVDVLANTMIDLATNGDSQQTFENADICAFQ